MPGITGLVMHDRRGREKWQYFFSRAGPKIGVLRQTQNQIFSDPVSGQKPIARPAAIRDMPEASVLEPIFSLKMISDTKKKVLEPGRRYRSSVGLYGG